MRLKALICEVLAREAYYCAAKSPHVVDIELFEKGLHTIPSDLRAALQHSICATPDRYDAIALGYGLCGNAIAGLQSCRVPLIVPRAHDCITLYLGSRERYRTYFTANPGTYYYTADYIERSDKKRLTALGTGSDGDMQAEYEEYVVRYGQDNADYLMEVMGAWRKHYSRATYIDIPGPQLPDYRQVVQDEAARRGWAYDEITGAMSLLWDLLHGNWDEDRFLYVVPAQRIAPSYGLDIIKAE